MKKILVPTDFSENATHAYPYAQELARAFDAEVLVAYVSDLAAIPVGLGQFPVTWESLELDIKDFAKQQFELLRKSFDSSIKLETIQLEGTPFVELLHLAKDKKVDVIVIATHGHTGIKHLLLGSTAEKIVRKAPCPVLTVHPGERKFVLP
jgi:nucleotide-binding universal stress UspA family protein